MSAGRRGESVPKGGLWDSKTPAYSKDTQNLLKVMMQESKLTSFQQRQLSQAMKEGGPLPMRCNPTTSAQPAPPAKPASKQLSGRLDGRMLSGSGLRSKEAIEETGAYERPKYIPGPSKNLDKEKQRLANYMAYGEDIPPITEKRKQEILRIQTPPPEKDRFDELQEEIQERAEFLEDMKRLGKEQQYKAIIATEISQRIREMEVIDKQRTAKLQKALKLQQEKDS